MANISMLQCVTFRTSMLIISLWAITWVIFWPRMLPSAALSLSYHRLAAFACLRIWFCRTEAVSMRVCMRIAQYHKGIRQSGTWLKSLAKCQQSHFANDVFVGAFFLLSSRHSIRIVWSKLGKNLSAETQKYTHKHKCTYSWLLACNHNE